MTYLWHSRRTVIIDPVLIAFCTSQGELNLYV